MGCDPSFLNIFKKMCRTRYFELEVVKAHKKGLIDAPVYLSIGQESISATASEVFKDCLIFAQHRAHSVYLAFDGDPKKLRDELLSRETGCCGGRGGSPCIQSPENGVIFHEGLIGDNIPISVGAALGQSGRSVLAFAGDAAYEEDYAISAMGFAATHKLPVLFICEDNDLSILTPKSVRRSWKISDVARSMGLASTECNDDPSELLFLMDKVQSHLPAFMNCKTTRHRWHVGPGQDGKPEEDRLEIFRKELLQLGFKKANKIEKKAKKEMEDLWHENLH